MKKYQNIVIVLLLLGGLCYGAYSLLYHAGAIYNAVKDNAVVTVMVLAGLTLLWRWLNGRTYFEQTDPSTEAEKAYFERNGWIIAQTKWLIYAAHAICGFTELIAFKGIFESSYDDPKIAYIAALVASLAIQGMLLTFWHKPIEIWMEFGMDTFKKGGEYIMFFASLIIVLSLSFYSYSLQHEGSETMAHMMAGNKPEYTEADKTAYNQARAEAYKQYSLDSASAESVYRSDKAAASSDKQSKIASANASISAIMAKKGTWAVRKKMCEPYEAQKRQAEADYNAALAAASRKLSGAVGDALETRRAKLSDADTGSKNAQTQADSLTSKGISDWEKKLSNRKGQLWIPNLLCLLMLPLFNLVKEITEYHSGIRRKAYQKTFHASAVFTEASDRLRAGLLLRFLNIVRSLELPEVKEMGQAKDHQFTSTGVVRSIRMANTGNSTSSGGGYGVGGGYGGGGSYSGSGGGYGGGSYQAIEDDPDSDGGGYETPRETFGVTPSYDETPRETFGVTPSYDETPRETFGVTPSCDETPSVTASASLPCDETTHETFGVTPSDSRTVVSGFRRADGPSGRISALSVMPGDTLAPDAPETAVTPTTKAFRALQDSVTFAVTPESRRVTENVTQNEPETPGVSAPVTANVTEPMIVTRVIEREVGTQNMTNCRNCDVVFVRTNLLHTYCTPACRVRNHRLKNQKK